MANTKFSKVTVHPPYKINFRIRSTGSEYYPMRSFPVEANAVYLKHGTSRSCYSSEATTKTPTL